MLKNNILFNLSYKKLLFLLSYFLFLYFPSINSIHADFLGLNFDLPAHANKGRDGCLLNKPKPGGAGYYKYCAQESNATTYADPLINIKLQVCSAFSCVANSQDLSWNGECTIFSGPFMHLPLTRFCARLAMPEETGFDADPGYTSGVHLDTNGNVVADPIIYDDNGNQIDFKVPKLCVYLDPGSDTFAPDFFDSKAYKQPFHSNSGRINFVIQIIIFLLSIGESSSSITADLLNSVMPSTKGTDWIKNILEFNTDNDFTISALKAIGNLNSIVEDSNIGCVNIPVSYLPPPYPVQLQGPTFTLKAQQICPTFSDGVLLDYQPSSPPATTLYGSNIVTSSGCAMSTTENNAIQNAVRIGYDNIIPTCSVLRNQNNTVASSISSTNSDQCVDIYNMISMSDIHSNHNDLLGVCANLGSANTSPCVNINSQSSICTDNNCSNVRIQYAILLPSGTITMSSFYDNTGKYQPCTSMTTTTACQLIWGANFGNFKDLVVTFPEYVSDNDTSDLVTTDTINMAYITDIPIEARITRIYDNTSATPQPTNEICAYNLVNNDRQSLGCFTRPPSSKPMVASCNDTIANSKCSSNYLNPQLFSYVKVGNFTSGGPLSISLYDPNNPQTSDQYAENQPFLNLAGTNYTAFATDNTESLEMPFFGSKAINYNTIIGNYENNITPSSSNSAVYLDGIEYTNGAYYRGADLVCLSSTSYSTCPQDPKQCVLTKFSNATDIPCAEFNNLATTYTGLHFCTSTDTGCTQQAIVSYGSTTVIIKQCETNYCYTHNLNGGIDPLCIASIHQDDRVLPNISTLVLQDSDYFDPSVSNVIPDACSNSTMMNDLLTTLSNTYSGITLCTSSQQSSCSFSTTENSDNNSQFIVSIYTCTNTDGSKSYCALANLGYDNNLCTLRNKTSLEQNWCVSVTQPYCPAIASSDSNSNGASWPQTNVGDLATVTCPTGTISSSLNGNTLNRYCLMNYSSKTASFENISENCVAICSSTSGEYNASWAQAYATGNSSSNQSNGTCLSGYVMAPSISSLQRTCNTDGTLSSISVGCVATCSAVTEGNASWSQSYATGDSGSNQSTGTCLSGYEMPNGISSLQRTCNSDGSLSALDTNSTCVKKHNKGGDDEFCIGDLCF